MQKGLRRKLVSMYADAFRARGFFSMVAIHHPVWPFPSAERLPALLIPLMPWDTHDETSDDRQNDFRVSPTVLLWAKDPENELDLLKCDAADEVEETLLTLSRDVEFQADFSQLRIERADPTSLALMPWGTSPAQIIPPFGAIRFDTVVDFHYAGVGA